MTEPCVGCGGDKRLVDTEPCVVWWLCDVCGLSREEVVLDDMEGVEPPC